MRRTEGLAIAGWLGLWCLKGEIMTTWTLAVTYENPESTPPRTIVVETQAASAATALARGFRKAQVLNKGGRFESLVVLLQRSAAPHE